MPLDDSSGPPPGSVHYDSLLRAERQAVLTRVTSSLAHALGTPLNVIAGRAALASMSSSSPAEVAENCEIISRQVKAITNLLGSVLKFAREGWPPPATVELKTIAEVAVELLRPLADARGVPLQLEAEGNRSAAVQADSLLHVLSIVLSLGLSGTRRASRIRVTADAGHSEPPTGERGRVHPGEYARYRVELQGYSVDQHLLDHVYEPWLHPAELDRDVALALATAFGMTREHRGWVGADPATDGLRLTVFWPIGTG